MGALTSAAQVLTAPDAWKAMKVTSSSTSVAASASTAAVSTSFSFDVTRLASRQSYVSAGSVTGMTALVASPGSSLTFNRAGEAISIHVGDGSLASVMAAINADPDLGIKASTVQVSPGNYRLQLASTASGAAAAFTVDGLSPDLGGLQELSAAADAEITVGRGSPAAYTISSGSNTFTDVLPGVTFTVSSIENGVTLDVSPNAEKIAASMQALVDAANNALAEISKLSAYDPETKKGGPLVGDSTVRGLTQQILGALSSASGALVPGVSLTKTGTATFDKDAFLGAYTADPAKVRSAVALSSSFTPAAASTGSVEVVRLGDGTRAGSYEIVITQAARRASATLDLAGLTPGQQLTVSMDGKVLAYTTDGTETPTSLAEALTRLAKDKGLDLAAEADGGALRIHSLGYGSAQTFEVSGDYTASATGTDVEGTINGVAATGTGQLLTTPVGTRGVGAVTVRVTLNDADVTALAGGVAGSVEVNAGLAQRLSAVSIAATNADNGSLTTVINSRTSMVKTLDAQISAWDRRLTLRRAALERQYAALEVALGKLQDQSTWLAGQLSGLSGSAKS
jgi:flagellar hook-associated protein 2